MIAAEEISERRLVMSHVWQRTNAAWDSGDDVEANDLNRLHGVLESLTDGEYRELYSGCNEADL